MINTMIERNPRGKGFIPFMDPLVVPGGKPRQELTQGRNLEAGSEAEGLEENWLLAYSLHSSRQLNSTTQDPLPVVSWDLPQ